MKKIYLKAALVVAFLAFAALPAFLYPAAAAAFGNGYTSSFSYPLYMSILSCDGSNSITITGNQHSVVHTTTAESGNTLARVSINFQNVKATDEFGNHYSFQNNIHFSTQCQNDGSGCQTPVELSELRLIGQGQAVNTYFRYHSHVTINSNGEPTAVFTNIDTDCK